MNSAHWIIFPTARHSPFPPSFQVTTQLPNTAPLRSSVCATVSSVPGAGTSDEAGNCTSLANSQVAKGRVVSTRKSGSNICSITLVVLQQYS